MPRRRSRLARILLSDGVIATVVVVGIIALALFGTLVLTWLVFRDRYGVGFGEYLRLFVL